MIITRTTKYSHCNTTISTLLLRHLYGLPGEYYYILLLHCIEKSSVLDGGGVGFTCTVVIFVNIQLTRSINLLNEQLIDTMRSNKYYRMLYETKTERYKIKKMFFKSDDDDCGSLTNTTFRTVGLMKHTFCFFFFFSSNYVNLFKYIHACMSKMRG